MIDLDSIKAFLTVAQFRSFSAAADQLHLTQPAVSKRIALLEHQLGVKLFDRIGRTVSLTQAGEELAPRATVILAEVEDTQRAIGNLNNAVSGRLTLATSHHVGLWRLPSVLKAFSDRYPDVALDLHFMDSEVAHEQIVQGNLEIGIITLAPRPHERLAARQIWNDELVFVCAADHPLAQLTTPTLAAIADYPAVLPDISTFTGRIVKGLFSRAQLSLQVSMSTNYLETIKMLVAIGQGWSVLPRTMIDQEMQVLALPDIHLTRQLGVIHHVQRTLSNAAQVFIELLEQNRDPDLE